MAAGFDISNRFSSLLLANRFSEYEGGRQTRQGKVPLLLSGWWDSTQVIVECFSTGKAIVDPDNQHALNITGVANGTKVDRFQSYAGYQCCNGCFGFHTVAN